MRLNRGISVAQPVSKVHDTFPARRIIGCGAIPLAVAKATPAVPEKLRQAFVTQLPRAPPKPAMPSAAE